MLWVGLLVAMCGWAMGSVLEICGWGYGWCGWEVVVWGGWVRGVGRRGMYVVGVWSLVDTKRDLGCFSEMKHVNYL